MDRFTEINLGRELGYLEQPKGFATRSIHFGQESDSWKSRAIVPPIVTSTIFEVSLPIKKCHHFYGRQSNPTREVLEKNLANLDGAKYATVFSAGSSAIASIVSILSPGDEIISSKKFYTGTTDIFASVQRYGIKVHYVDYCDAANIEKALTPNTKIIWAEPLTNPLMSVVDIRALCEVVHKKSNAYVVVDNTFLTPYFHRPLELGADIVLYSLTKYFSGHSDVIGGSICTNNEELFEAFNLYQISCGTMLSPFDCYLINRSIKTLALRMESHFKNSFFVAKWLEDHPKVDKVLHPSLASFEGHKVSLKQFYGHSGIFSFYLKDDDYEVTKKFTENLKLILFATSLGGVETTLSFPEGNVTR